MGVLGAVKPGLKSGCTSGLRPPVGRPGLATETALRNHRSEVGLGLQGSAGKESDKRP